MFNRVWMTVASVFTVSPSGDLCVWSHDGVRVHLPVRPAQARNRQAVAAQRGRPRDQTEADHCLRGWGLPKASHGLVFFLFCILLATITLRPKVTYERRRVMLRRHRFVVTCKYTGLMPGVDVVGPCVERLAGTPLDDEAC